MLSWMEKLTPNLEELKVHFNLTSLNVNSNRLMYEDASAIAEALKVKTVGGNKTVR
jgi:hypothetical protein